MKKVLNIILTLGFTIIPIINNSTVKAVGTGMPDDPTYFTPWSQNNGTTADPVAMEEFTLNGVTRLFQAVRGNGFPYWIYIRSTSDGNFDATGCLPVTQAQTNLECWDRVGINGQTSRQVSLVSFTPTGATDPKLFIAVRGGNAKIYTKSMDNTGVWSNWNENGGTTTNTIAQTEFNGKLYQAVRGNGSNRMFVRSTADGVFTNGDSTENWIEINGQTQDDMALTSGGGKLFMTVRGSSGRLFTRWTSDGATWSNWQENSERLSKTPATISFYNDSLYQVIAGFDNKVYTRVAFIDTNSLTWGNWQEDSGTTDRRIEMKTFDGKLFQAYRGLDSQIYTRRLMNLSSYTSTSTNFSLSFRFDSEMGNAESVIFPSAVPNNIDDPMDIESINFTSTDFGKVRLNVNPLGSGGGNVCAEYSTNDNYEFWSSEGFYITSMSENEFIGIETRETYLECGEIYPDGVTFYRFGIEYLDLDSTGERVLIKSFVIDNETDYLLAKKQMQVMIETMTLNF